MFHNSTDPTVYFFPQVKLQPTYLYGTFYFLSFLFSKYDLEVMIQEEEFEYLQKAVWDYTDNFREQNGALSQDGEGGGSNPTLDSFSCIREYDDDLFPGICQYLQKCRESPTCQMKNTPKVSPGGHAGTEDPIVNEFGELSPLTNPLNIFQESFPLRVAGAGRSRGLTLMLDTLRCDSIPTDSFKGLRVSRFVALYFSVQRF